ncbi:MAG: response regulator transcription factor [Firmicutes bacterium]|nr:response regulator transcription factor [Bacillota bacterium]
MYHILICDDERDIVSALKIYLDSPDYSLHTAENGMQAVELCREMTMHLVLMDIMMPVMDGIRAMQEIREFSNVPIILLTAKGEDSDKILGLGNGADDYITKPFNPMEVLARVKSALRRYVQLGSALPQDHILEIGGIRLDDAAKEVYVDGEKVQLTRTEIEILKMLMKEPGKVFSSKAIYEHVWKDDPFGVENTVAVHIRHLREKIEINPAQPRYVKVVWGQGYKFEKEVHLS